MKSILPAVFSLTTSDRISSQTEVADPYSNFVSLEDGATASLNQAVLSSTDLFYEIYTGPERVVFQTCIPTGESKSWGRLFVIATPHAAWRGSR